MSNKLNDSGLVMETIVGAAATAGLTNKEMNIGVDASTVMIEKLEGIGHEADSSTVANMDVLLEAAAAHMIEDKVAHEYTDNAEQFNPISLTIGAASALDMLDTPLKSWAPTKTLPYHKKQITLELPHITVSTVENGRLIKGVKIVDLDIDDVESKEARIIATFDAESLPYLDVDSQRGPNLTGKTASLQFGTLVPLLEVSRQRDLSNAELGYTDILRPAGRLNALNIEVAPGEILRVNADDVITMANIFEGNSSGDVKYEKMQADFTLILTSDSTMLADGEGIRTGVRVPCPTLAGAIPPSDILVVKITVDVEVDLKAPSMQMINQRFEIVKSVVGGVDTVVDPLSAVGMLEFKVVSYDADCLLTDTNHRALGNFITDDANKYPFTTRQRDPISSGFPTLAKDRTKDSKATFTTLKRQAYINDTRMTKFYVKQLEAQFELMKSSIAANVPLNIPNENNFRTTVVEANHTMSAIQVMRTSDNLEVAKVSLQHTIESVAKELVEASGWKRSINLFGVSSYKVKILAEEKMNLDSFTMTNGVFVEVTKTEYVKGKMWISLEANGGPVVDGIKLLQLSNMLCNASTTYSATRTDGASKTAYMTNVPYYDVMWKLNILGKITIS